MRGMQLSWRSPGDLFTTPSPAPNTRAHAHTTQETICSTQNQYRLSDPGHPPDCCHDNRGVGAQPSFAGEDVGQVAGQAAKVDKQQQVGQDLQAQRGRTDCRWAEKHLRLQLKAPQTAVLLTRARKPGLL